MTTPGGAVGLRDTSRRFRVVVAILTFHRPRELVDLLRHLDRDLDVLNHAVPLIYTANIVVVDNDPKGSAEQPVRALGMDRVRYVHEPTPGIAAARNRALDEAEGEDLLAFIDDDELPGERWLDLLLATWAATEAAAVPGAVVASYPAPLDSWLIAGRFFARFDLPTGTRVKEAAAGNLLLDMGQIRRLGVRFNEAFGFSGGEDSLFSRQLIMAGGHIVWCNEAFIVDRVPISRMTRTWVLHRSMSHGNTQRLIAQYLAPHPIARVRARCVSIAGGAIRVGAGSLRCALGATLGRKGHHARGLRTVYRGIGMLAAAVGYVYEEYNRDGDHRRGLKAFAPVPLAMRERHVPDRRPA